MSERRLGSIGQILDASPARRRLVDSPPPETAGASPAPVAPVAEVTPTTEDRQKDQKQAAKAPRRPSATAATKARVPVRLPDELSKRLNAAAHEQRQTLIEVLFDALEAAARTPEPVERLIDVAQRPAVTQGALFTRPEKRVAAPKVQVEFGMTAANAQALDLMVKQLRASNRSELIVAALDAHLT